MRRLSDYVTISRQFLRSVRIDSDFGREDALRGYVCQGTARAVLESMAVQIKETKQRAFTWTGPYGGGKSSLALMLCSLVGGSLKLRRRAKEILDLPHDSPVFSAFNARSDGWVVFPIVGARTKVTEKLHEALSNRPETRNYLPKEYRASDIIDALVGAAERHPQGVMVVIDELGKFLEAAAQDGDDIGFFQDLAEAASRSSGKLVVVGILHQSFEAYASRLGRQTRDDWAKVQGRFIDIPLVAASDEVVELVGRAMKTTPIERLPGAAASKVIAESIKQRRPGTSGSIEISLGKCWPLHPVVAVLLGPISRRRFSQNERSTFGFLASREPHGFMEFLDTPIANESSMYGPSKYWDYLVANLETAILASPDGHRWATAAEAVERAIAKGTPLHVELTKCVALIELFRSGSGLLPEAAVLEACIPGTPATKVAAALRDLIQWKVLIERKHLEAYGVFAGSDFDIEAAVVAARMEIGTPNVHQLSALTDLQPILAKRLYHETGALRWFNRKIAKIDEVQTEIDRFLPAKGSVGTFLLCLPDTSHEMTKAFVRVTEITASSSQTNLIIGIPANADRIAELGLEYAACDRVLKTRTELDGDAVARKELLGRFSSVRQNLEDDLADAFSQSSWIWNGRLLDAARGKPIAWVASHVAAQVFPRSPILHNELVNRQEPSSNSKTARKALLNQMVSHSAESDLGYEGFSADASLYLSILKPTGIHGPQGNDHIGFRQPNSESQNENLLHLWKETESVFLREGVTTKLSKVYEFWSAAPYGVRDGILPILGMAFFLSHRAMLALYVGGTFTSDVTSSVVDEWLFDPDHIELKFVSASLDQKAYIDLIIQSLPSGIVVASDKPLDVARALVSIAVGLPNWTKRTTSLSQKTQAIRSMLLKANDPHKVLFSDLPSILEVQKLADTQKQLSTVLFEILSAYPKALHQVRETLLRALDQTDGDYSHLQKRAAAVKGLAGEFRLEAFIVRLETFDGSDTAVESLISLGNSKAPAQWIDRDIDAALLQLGSWSHEFRKAETVVSLRGRPSTRRALSVVFGGSLGTELTVSADIDERDSSTVKLVADQLIAELKNQPKEIALAALAEVGAALFEKSSGVNSYD